MASAAKLGCVAALSLSCAGPLLAQELTISRLEHYTENRGWNEAGIGPTYQTVITATVAPSGLPTLVFAEQGGLREPLTHYAQPSTPDLYLFWRRFDPARAGAWRIVAERAGALPATAEAPALARPQKLPLLRKLRATGRGGQPRLRWALPDLAGFDVDRIRVAVHGGSRVQGRFMSVLFTSADLPPTATSYTIPAGVLRTGERYVFRVMLDDLEGDAVENRSSTFARTYTVSP